jgi:hypothetical protein
MFGGLLNDAFINDPDRVAGAQMALSLLGAASGRGARLAKGLGGAIEDRRNAPMRKLQQQMGSLQLQQLQQQVQAPQLQAAQQAQIQAAIQDAMQSGKRLSLPDLVMRGLPLDVAAKVLDAQEKGKSKPITVVPGATVWDPDAGLPLFRNPKEETLTDIGKLIAERDKLPQGHPARQLYDAAILTKAEGRPLVDLKVNMGQGDSRWGPAPKDTVWARDKDGNVMLQPDERTGAMTPIAVPITGGPVSRDQADAARRAAERQRNIAMAGGTVVQDIGRGLELLNEFPRAAAGPGAWLTKDVPATPANRLQQFIESIASNIGIDRLQAMRESSPTGGALGQVPFQQQVRLEQLLGSLDIRQPKDVLEANMKRISNMYMDLIHGTPEEIRANASRLGLTDADVKKLAHRFDLPFDELGRPRQQQPPSRWQIQRLE